MAPARFRLACVGLCLLLGCVAPAPVAWAGANGMVDTPDAMRSDWARDLRQDLRFEIRHVESQRRPVPFPTTLPSEYLDQIEHAKATVKGEKAAPFADLLAQILANPSDLKSARSACPERVERDNITLGSGKGEHALLMTFSPSLGTLVITDPKQHGASYRLGPRGSTLLALLGDAFPKDARLLTIVVCTDTLAPDSLSGDLPKPGEFVYVEELPEAISKVQPYYPPDRINADVEGTVMVQALVSKDGEVVKTAVVKSILGLDEHAVRAVEQWKFKPAMSNGKPLAVWVAIPVRFRLK
jgi:TonB family protein